MQNDIARLRLSFVDGVQEALRPAELARIVKELEKAVEVATAIETGTKITCNMRVIAGPEPGSIIFRLLIELLAANRASSLSHSLSQQPRERTSGIAASAAVVAAGAAVLTFLFGGGGVFQRIDESEELHRNRRFVVEALREPAEALGVSGDLDRMVHACEIAANGIASTALEAGLTRVEMELPGEMPVVVFCRKKAETPAPILSITHSLHVGAVAPVSQLVDHNHLYRLAEVTDDLTKRKVLVAWRDGEENPPKTGTIVWIAESQRLANLLKPVDGQRVYEIRPG